MLTQHMLFIIVPQPRQASPFATTIIARHKPLLIQRSISQRAEEFFLGGSFSANKPDALVSDPQAHIIGTPNSYGLHFVLYVFAVACGILRARHASTCRASNHELRQH